MLFKKEKALKYLTKKTLLTNTQNYSNQIKKI